MFNVKNYEYDCTRKCRYQQHGNQITAAMTRRSVQDEKLAAFIAKTCCNYTDIVDDLGRSAVHMAASLNRYVLLEWLLNQGAIINNRDFISGSSALHRAIYYGCIDCAVLLMRYGASLELLDEDARSALQNTCRLSDHDTPKQLTSATANEVFVWGSNKNNNLGIGNETAVNAPLCLDYFRKEHISIEGMALGTYHSLFLDNKSRVYAVGHGEGGRLGVGDEKSLPEPKKVKVALRKDGESVIDLSVSRNHSLLLTDRSAVFACGLNDSKQLGVRSAGDKLTSFKEVVTLRDLNVKNLRHVVAKDCHSLTYSENELYFWGTNHGQFGLEANIPIVEFPTQSKHKLKGEIRLVESNDSATVVVTTSANFMLFYQYKVSSLILPYYEKVKSVCIVGGDTAKSSKGTATALKLLLLTHTNILFFWYEMSQQFYRCSLTQLRVSQFDKILYRGNQLLILSHGDVYVGKCTQTAVPAIVRKEEEEEQKCKTKTAVWIRFENKRSAISKDHMIRIDLRRMAEVDRVIDIGCNEDFTAFAVIQESNSKYFKMPQLPAEEYTFAKLLNDVNEFDAVHDVVFHVENATFAAHKFIVCSRSQALHDIVKTCSDKHIYLNFEKLTSGIFELLLKHIYTNYLPNAIDLEDIRLSLGQEVELLDTSQLLLEQATRFQLSSLVKYLKTNLLEKQSDELKYYGFVLSESKINENKLQYRPNRLNRKSFPTLYDVRILCADEQELAAHKCVLVGRLEFFDMMFMHSWSEQHTINLSTITLEYMEPIIDFLYNNDVEQFRKQNHTETFLYNMIVYCDQFFIEQLRRICELLILEKISIRKCSEMLDFAHTYNCDLLRKGCFDYICLNLSRFLYHHSLEQCEPMALKGLNEHYRNMFKSVFDYRQITPDSSIDENLLLSFVDDFTVDLNYRMDKNEDTKSSHNNKTLQQESKNKQSTRKYELEAIHSMKEKLHLNESSPAKDDGKLQFLNEMQEIAEQIQSESKSWMKVVDKKDQKKKLSLEHALKANEQMKHEDKPKVEFVPLNSRSADKKVTTTPEKDLNNETLESCYSNSNITPTKSYNFNLADFTPSREKLSQKQRKRLPSNSETGSNVSWRSPTATANATKPIAVPAQPNAWGITPSIASATAESFTDSIFSQTAITGSSQDPTSFANMMRSHGATTAVAKSNSFSRIQAEERKQRDYYERMRNKSLLLTQIEEKAMAELREFYNVDNVQDEVITIERKSMPATMNFAVWHRQ